MFFIIGLGNPGPKYFDTRHNVGHWLVDQLDSLEGSILRKTSVSMNSSGLEVKKLLDEFKLPIDNLIVAHDDVDLELGTFRLQKGRGSAGHKGVQSIIDALGAQNFWRLRVGIGRPPAEMETEEHVLGRFGPQEFVQLKELAPKLIEGLKSLYENG